MSKQTFATAINCMDGRVQLPVIEWMKDKYSVEYIDMITAAGPNNVLLNGEQSEVDSIIAKVQISYEKHGSEVIAIVGHHDCAGNPVSKEEQIIQIKECMNKIHSWEFPLDVVGLFVNENWEVEVI